MLLSQMAGRQLPLFSLIVPAWLVATMSGWRGVKGCWPAIVVCGGSFSLMQYLVSNFHGPTLVDVIGGLGSLVCLAVFLRFWQPKEIWRFPDERETSAAEPDEPPLTVGQVTYAWMPWVLLSAVIFLWGWPDFKTASRRQPEELPTPWPAIAKFSFCVPSCMGWSIARAPSSKSIPNPVVHRNQRPPSTT